MIKSRFTSVLLLVLLVMFAGAACFAELKDYANAGPDFQILKDIRLEALEVSFVEKREITVLRQNMKVSVFSVKTREAVKFDDIVSPYNNVIKDLDIYYELMVGDDSDNLIHDKLIAEIYSICADSKAKQSDFDDVGVSGISGVSGTSGSPGSYLLYRGGFKTPDLVWFGGKFIHLKFVRLAEKRRDRVPTTETFWNKKIGLFPGAQKMPLDKMKKESRAAFLASYAEGKFKRAAAKK